MTAAPSLQISLFEPPAASKTKLCSRCKRERKLSLFAWKDAAHTEREDVCTTCRFLTELPQSKRKANDAPTKPTLAIPQPPPLWVKQGDTVRILLNVEGTGEIVTGLLYVTNVRQKAKLSSYLGLRNILIRWGYYIAEIRQAVGAPLLEKRVNT